MFMQNVLHTALRIYLLLQDCLLLNLGVSPVSSEPWPMTVYSRTLAVLAEVILLRQQKERELSNKAIKSVTEAQVINIWNRFTLTLKDAILSFDNKVDQFEGKFYKYFHYNFICDKIFANDSILLKLSKYI